MLADVFLAVDLLADVLLAGVDLLAVDLLVDVFLAVDFLAGALAVDLLAAAFLAGVDFFAVAFVAEAVLPGAAFLAVAATAAGVALATLIVSLGNVFAPETTFLSSAPGLNERTEPGDRDLLPLGNFTGDGVQHRFERVGSCLTVPLVTSCERINQLTFVH